MHENLGSCIWCIMSSYKLDGVSESAFWMVLRGINISSADQSVMIWSWGKRACFGDFKGRFALQIYLLSFVYVHICMKALEWTFLSVTEISLWGKLFVFIRLCELSFSRITYAFIRRPLNSWENMLVDNFVK